MVNCPNNFFFLLFPNFIDFDFSQVAIQHGTDSSRQHQLPWWGGEDLPVLEGHWRIQNIHENLKGEAKVSLIFILF